MACGCAEVGCSCIVTGAGETSVSGAGTVANPFVVSTPASPTFAATNPGGGIDITPNGTLGHAPAFDLVIDPASTAPVSVGVDGLLIDCCDTGAGARRTAYVDSAESPYQVNFGIEDYIIVDSGAGAVVVELPLAPTDGQLVTVRWHDDSAFYCEVTSSDNDIDPGSLETIASNTVRLYFTGHTADFVYDSTAGLWMVGNHAMSASGAWFDDGASATGADNVQGAIDVIATLARDQTKRITVHIDNTDSPYAVSLTTDDIIWVDTTGGAVTVTLPAGHTDGETVGVIDEAFNSSVNAITVETADADLINGSASDYVINTDGSSLSFISNGTDWYIQ